MSQTIHISEVVAWLGLTTDQRDGLCLKAPQSRAGAMQTAWWGRRPGGKGIAAFGHSGHPSRVHDQTVLGPSIPSINLRKYVLLVMIQGSWHLLMSTTQVASSEICLLTWPWAPAMSLAGRLAFLSFTDTFLNLHFIFMVL